MPFGQFLTVEWLPTITGKVRIDGQSRSLDEDPKLDRRRNHAIDVLGNALTHPAPLAENRTEGEDQEDHRSDVDG